MIVLLFTVLTVVSAIMAIAARILIMFAVNFDCRARNLKSTTLFTVLTFFFPVIVGIIYAATRANAEPNEKFCAACNLRFDGSAKMCPTCGSPSLMPVLKPNAKELAKKGVTLCIIGIIVFAVGISAGVAQAVVAVRAGLDVAENYSEEDIENNVENFLKDYLEDEGESTTAADDSEEDTTDIGDILGSLTYYDRNGKAYDSAEKVPFYDRDGNAYLFRQKVDGNEIETWFENEKTGDKLKSDKCFIDKDGYFVYDEKGEITMTDIVTGKDKDGNTYIPASLAIWNEKGELITVLD